jgi:hypothetical protein
MSPTVVAVDQVDLDLALAAVALGVARTRFEHSGSAENTRLLEEAQAQVDLLLDERLDRTRAAA